MISENRQEFNRRWNGRDGWNYQYRIAASNRHSSVQVEHYMWVAFQAGVRFGKKKGGKE